MRRITVMTIILWTLAVGLSCTTLVAAEAKPKYRVILNTDIGDDIDDVFALALLARSPEVKLEAVVTTIGDQPAKAALVRRLLDLAGLQNVPVYCGLAGKYPGRKLGQMEWGRGYNSSGVIGQDGIDELVRRAKEARGKLTLVSIGPLNNLGAALEQDPDFGRNLREIVLMGGSVYHGYGREAQSAEFNIECDRKASQMVFASGAKLLVVPLDSTYRQRVSADQLTQLAQSQTPIAQALTELVRLWHTDPWIRARQRPTLYDVRTVAVLLNAELAGAQPLRLEVSAAGFTNVIPGEPNCRVVLEPKQGLLMKLAWERYLAVIR